MYVNIPHYYIPKLCGILAFIFNPLFVYLLHTDKKLQLGAYRYLLISFSFFNMLCSLYDTLVPMCVHDYRYAFVVFVSDGPFVNFSDLGQLALSVCECFFYGDYERKSYVHDSFEELYHEDSRNMTMVIALYWEGSNDAVVRSWIGVVIVTASTAYSMSLYFVLGHKIMKKLKVQTSLSEKTINLQRQLFNALTIQTVIPICVSLMPCLAVWFGPVFLLDFRWFSCLSVDFYITFLFQPQPLHPIPAGFSTGLLSSFLRCPTIMTLSCLSVDFYITFLFQPQPLHPIPAGFSTGLLSSFLRCSTIMTKYRSYEQQFLEVYDTLAVYDINPWWIGLLSIVVIGFVYSASFFIFSTYSMHKILADLSKNLSSVNQKKQRMALISLVIQLIVLATAVTPVGLLALFLMIEFEYAQTATRIELMVYCFHSTANAIALILTTPPFRRFTFFWVSR
ncbi:unnamed protein product [Caenorhabditis nigoni]